MKELTPVQLDQRKRLISRMAGNIAAGLVTDIENAIDLGDEKIAASCVDLAIQIVNQVEARLNPTKAFDPQKEHELCVKGLAHDGPCVPNQPPFGDGPWGG